MSTSTKTTTAAKPSGKCAACHKEAASKRCVPCKNVGVDIFFCNRDCQMKAWKEHKLVCGYKTSCPSASSPATTSKPEEEDSFRKNLKELNDFKETKKNLKMMKEVSKSMCQNCLKRRSDVVKLLVCANCNNIHYCSRKCQKAHWSQHKPFCKSNSESTEKLKKTLDSPEKNILTLLESWKRKALSVMLPAACSVLTKNEIKQQPPTKLVAFYLEFSYNAQTFLFAQQPEAMLISEALPAQQETIAKMSKEYSQSSPGYITQFAIILCKELGNKYASIKPLSFEAKGIRDFSYVDMAALNKMSVNLKLHNSKLFHGWHSYKTANMERQIKYLQRTNAFSGFLQNALNLFCRKRRHMTHGVIVHLKMAPELGKIAEFEKYEVKSIQHIKDQLALTKTSKEDLALVNSEMDVHNCPKLVLSRSRYPENIIMVICYVDPHTHSAVMVKSNLFDLSQVDQSGTVKRCKREADAWFNELQMNVKCMPAALVQQVKL